MRKIKLSAITLIVLLMMASFAYALIPNLELENEVEVEANSDINAGANAFAKPKEVGIDIKAEAVTKSEVKAADADVITDEEIDVSIKSVASASGKATSFTTVSIGTGWVLSSTEGKFLRIMWAEGSFISDNGDETIKSHGVLKMNKDKAYRLSIKEKTDSSIEFDVFKGTSSVGTLLVNEETQVTGLTVWNGKLVIEGNSYDVNLASKTGKVKPEGKAKLKASVEVETEGDVSVNSKIKEKSQALKESLDESSATEIKIKAEKRDGEISVKTEMKGSLSSEQEALIKEIELELREALQSAEEKASIEIKAEVEASSTSSGSINSGNGNAWGKIKAFFGLN